MTNFDYIKKETEFIFNVDYLSDDFNSTYEDRAYALIKEYPWEEVYPIWREYVYDHGNTFQSLVNLAYLLFVYDIDNDVIPDPYEFCSFFMYRWDIRELWDEGGEMIEELVAAILHKCGYIKYLECAYIFDDEILNAHIEQWRKRNG